MIDESQLKYLVIAYSDDHQNQLLLKKNRYFEDVFKRFLISYYNAHRKLDIDRL
jgi:hypothetical protein